LFVANLLLQVRRLASRVHNAEPLRALLALHLSGSPAGTVQPLPSAAGDRSRSSGRGPVRSAA
jgi:hypothetical protein